MATSPAPAKDTIYIDIDDEITGIIDKVRGSNGKIVALVLPKRASVLQSVVNMRLLKRAADDANKHLVLITTERGLLPLAGLAGVLVAANASSKPEVPAGPLAPDENVETVDEDTGETAIDTKNDGDKTVGELAGLGTSAALANDVETIELDDESELPEDIVPTKDFASAAVANKKAKKNKDKKLAVPNFERFRVLIILGAVALIALIAGLYVCLAVLPKASIAITTNATNVNTNINLTANSQENALNESTHVLPAKLVQQQKTYSQTVNATGQKNTGTKATGTVTVTNCTSDGSEVIIPAGTGISANGVTYITQQTADLKQSSFKGKTNQCQSFDGISSKSIDITAQSGGANYNTNQGTSFTVAGYSDVEALANSAISGGTDNITKVVSQTDIDSAASKIMTNDSTVKQALENQLTQAGMYAIVATYNAGTPATTNSANVGDTADSVTVTQTISYSMFGVQQSDLKTLVDNSVKSQIDTGKQSILDEGLKNAQFNETSSTATTAQLTLQTVAEAGPQLSTSTIASQVAGKKAGDVKTLLQADPDVTGVNVKLSPFFVTSVPKKTSRITVTIAKPTVTSSSNGSNNP